MSNNRPQRQSSMSRQNANNPRDQSPPRRTNQPNNQVARQPTNNQMSSRQNSMAQSLMNANNNNTIVKNKDGEYAPVGQYHRTLKSCLN